MKGEAVSGCYRVAVIGCGRPEGTVGATGHGMGVMHAVAFERTGCCAIVAAADVRCENGAAFVERWPDAVPYLDYREMLAEARPEIVSICTWPHLHAEMVIACAEAGVKAVHCEKPMAKNWTDARRMVEACARAGKQLTINHQNRFREPYRVARDLVRGGAIGKLQSLQGTSSNLFNSHWVDLLFFYNDEAPVEWVSAQIDVGTVGASNGELREDRAVCSFQFVNGVHALLLTGPEATIGCGSRLIGTEGSIEVHGRAPRVRVQRKGVDGWQTIDVPDGPDWQSPLDRAIADVVAALDEAREPELSGQRALQSMEVIFAAYESNRRWSRVGLPLLREDAPPSMPLGST
jgi:UDP-N-acetylglucosamine 3-dehydrogenase